jgi:hypothetical protein
VLAALIAAAVAFALTVTSGPAPPATGAATLVPADALAYVNLSVDPSRTPVKQSLRLAKGFQDYPLGAASLQGWIGSLLGSRTPVDFAGDVRPWLGKEASLAVLDTSTSTAGMLLVLDVSDRSRARAFLTRSGVSPVGSYRGFQLLRAPNGTELAFVGHYLTVGQDAGVRAAIDVSQGSARSLARDPTYQRTAAGEPAGRVLDAYASAAGVQRVLASRGGPLGALGTLLYQPALQGVAMSVSPSARGADVRIHTELDRSLVSIKGTGATRFTPSLQDAIPSGAALMLDTTGLDRLAPRLLGAGKAAGVAGGVAPLFSRLGTALSAEGVNVSSILSIFHGESAIAITPGTVGVGQPPALVVVTRPANPTRAKAQLASLEVPLAQLFSAPAANAGGSPQFNDRVIDGVDVRQLSLTPGLQVDYAVWHGLVLVSTGLGGISAVISRHTPVAKEQEFREVLGVPDKRITSLLFLDLRQLLSLDEQMGLTHSALLKALLPDLERVRAVGMNSTGGEADSTAELFLRFP